MSETETCPVCHGSGLTSCPRHGLFSSTTIRECTECNGTNLIRCGSCGGSGKIVATAREISTISPSYSSTDYSSSSYSRREYKRTFLDGIEDFINYRIPDSIATIGMWIGAILLLLIGLAVGYQNYGIGAALLFGLIGFFTGKYIGLWLGGLVGKISGCLIAIPFGITKYIIENWKVVLPVSILVIVVVYFWSAKNIDINQPKATLILSAPSTQETSPLPVSVSSSSTTSVSPEGVAFEWTYELRNFSGNRDDVYRGIVKEIAPNMSWEQFKKEVLTYNPQLIDDGYEFKKDKVYLLPIEK